MSETQSETEAQVEPVLDVRPQSSPGKRVLAFALSGALALALLIFLQGMRASAMQREALGRGIDGLAASMSQAIIESNSQRFENRLERLQRTVEGVRAAGKYESVTVTDATGTVLATTDLKFRGQTIKELAESKQQSNVVNQDGALVASSGVFTEGGARVGGLRVVVRL